MPYSKARAYDAMALRLSGVLNDIFNFHYAFAEEFRAPFDQADPIGLIVSPWIGAPDFSVAKDQAEKEIADLLPFVEFARLGRARPFAYVIETLQPGQASASIRLAPVQYPYRGNMIRGWGNEIGGLIDGTRSAVAKSPELKTLTEMAVEAREDIRFETSITRYWAVLEALAKRWASNSDFDDKAISNIVWKGTNYQRNLKAALWCVWCYCHQGFYIPVHLTGPEHPLDHQLRASYYTRNLIMHGALNVSNADVESKLAAEFKAKPFPHQWFGLQHIVESALRHEMWERD